MPFNHSVRGMVRKDSEVLVDLGDTPEACSEVDLLVEVLGLLERLVERQVIGSVLAAFRDVVDKAGIQWLTAFDFD